MIAKGKKVITEQKEETLHFKSQFISDMAYQIRTLSNAIIGFSELLLYEGLTDTQIEFVEDVYNAGQSIATLISEVQDLSRIKAGQVNIDAVKCSLAELFDKIDS